MILAATFMVFRSHIDKVVCLITPLYTGMIFGNKKFRRIARVFFSTKIVQERVGSTT